MENIYDDLENYEEANIIEDLKNENSELKKKLEQYSSTINQLQINIFQDFENLSSEYKKLELNYSSLLKTARAEIERKTNMITQLNLEKDMMVIQAFQNKGRQCFRKVTYNNKTTSKNTDIDSRPKTEDIHCKMVGKRKSGHLCTMDIKENVLDSKQKTCSKNIPNFKETIPSQFKNRRDEEHVHLPKELRLRDDEALDKKSKNSDTIEFKPLYHNASVSTRSDNDRHSDYLYRQREKARHRRNSPQRISRHRSRSPPADRFSRHKSHDIRKLYNDLEHSAHQDRIPVNQIEQPVLKHKVLPHSEEPSQKKIRVDSYGTYAGTEKICGDSELISFSAALTEPEDPFGSCQSPDYLYCDADHSSIKEIIHTATTPQADPRITSKKYIVRAENGKEVLKCNSTSEIYLQRVNPSLWGIPKVIIPDALLQKPPSVQCLQDNLQTYSEINSIGLSTSLNQTRDDRNSSNAKVNSNGCLTKTSSKASEIPQVNSSHSSKLPQYSTNNDDFSSVLTNACKNKMPFINDTEPRQLVSLGTVEGDLLLSDEGSDNADRSSTADNTTIIKIKNTESVKNTFTFQSSSNSGENKMITNKNEEFDSKIPVDQENHFKNLPETEIPSKDSLKSLQNENNGSTIDIISQNAALSLESNKAEKSLSNKETSHLGKNSTYNVELDQVSDKNKSVNKVKVNVEIHKVPLDLPGKLKSEPGSEDYTDTSTKLEKPKKYQEPKRRQCPEKSDKQSKGYISNKKHKKKKLGETKFKECDKSSLKNTKIQVDTIAPDSHRKFCDLFGESSNSLIMPEDLGIRSGAAAESQKIKFASICNDTQNAVDHVENDPNPGPGLIKESTVDTRVDVNVTAGEHLTNGTVICSLQLTTQRPEKANLFENIKPAISTDSPDVVIISTGVQSKLLEGEIDGDISKNVSIDNARPLTALATSTPLKDQKCIPASRSVKDTVPDEAGDVPDVRIFVKRRRKIKNL
ncbi:uncharacterized protein LOC123707181 isoform X1 [Pieris brassicae]|uniref:uncharacterized protein LOC123707181 isoform X1 n=1 Tax=Pieris brassicae TaxID=7116 RepID=UPI001E660235|nr:uncharacterized protein LOC123707181 isoform X1 [Pieris brassicae]